MLEGTISYVPTRESTRDELESLPILTITPNSSTWNPHDSAFWDQEDNMLDYNGNVRVPNAPSYIVSKMSSDLITNSQHHIISSVQHRSLDPFILLRDLEKRKALSVPLPMKYDTIQQHDPRDTSSSFGVSMFRNTGAKSDLKADRLAEVFNISRNLAVNTLWATTRYCPRNISDITLNKRYSNNDCMLHYNCMSSELFLDTMFATKKGGKTLRGFQCCQVFATSFGWTLLRDLEKRKALSVPLPMKYDTIQQHDPRDTSSSFGVSMFRNTGAKSDLKADRLAEVFNISRNLAVNTLWATTRYCPRNISDITLNKRYSNNDCMLHYNCMSSELFLDTMFATKKGGKTLRGFQCCQVFATSFGWTLPILLNKESDAHMAVKRVFKKYGVPPEIICDAARTQVWGETKDFCAQTGCDLKLLEKGTPSANRAEAAIKILKHSTKKDLDASNCPVIFWCYCIERRAAINIF